MGRRRKDGDPLGLAGTRLAFSRGRFFYIHRGGNRWEDVGTDVESAKKAAARYNNPGDGLGTMAYWFALFLADFKLQVAAGTKSQRTLDDYTGYADEDGPLVASFGKAFPEQITPGMVQAYLEANAKLDPPRPVPANRERAFLSSCLSWMIRSTKVPGMVVNPCMRASGVKRNRETQRERYVTHEEYRAVYDAGNRAVKLAMELVYRTLQRPEDVITWTPRNITERRDAGGKVVRILRNQQGKTGAKVDIEITPEIDAILVRLKAPTPRAAGEKVTKVITGLTLIHRRDGKPYSYDGLCAMLKRRQAAVRADHTKAEGPLAKMLPWGFYDMKGKGATDMWLAGVPLTMVQALCGHDSVRTTEIYVKSRWRGIVTPNQTKVG